MAANCIFMYLHVYFCITSGIVFHVDFMLLSQIPWTSTRYVYFQWGLIQSDGFSYMATTVAKCVVKDILCFNAWWCRNLAIAVAVATYSVMALLKEKLQLQRSCLVNWSCQNSLHFFEKKTTKLSRAYRSKHRVETYVLFRTNPTQLQIMVLLQTFLYHISTVQRFKSYLNWFWMVLFVLSTLARCCWDSTEVKSLDARYPDGHIGHHCRLHKRNPKM